MSCVSLKIRKRMGNPRNVAPACMYDTLRYDTIRYATIRFLAMRGTQLEARAELTYRAAIAAAPGHAHAHSNLPDIHHARVHRR